MRRTIVVAGPATNACGLTAKYRPDLVSLARARQGPVGNPEQTQNGPARNGAQGRLVSLFCWGANEADHGTIAGAI
jgi:hypothetical protein